MNIKNEEKRKSQKIIITWKDISMKSQLESHGKICFWFFVANWPKNLIFVNLCLIIKNNKFYLMEDYQHVVNYDIDYVNYSRKK